MDLSASVANIELLHGLSCLGPDHSLEHCRVSLHLLGKGDTRATPCSTHLSVHQFRSDAGREETCPVPCEAQLSARASPLHSAAGG